MLLSAPDWGTGFDLGWGTPTLIFASAQNASIAGQTCTSGAQEVTAHVPKWQMAGWPSSWARSDGKSGLKNLALDLDLPWNRSAMDGSDPSVPHEKRVPIPGLNNGQGGGESGRWQW
eukprot:scaffold50890_cov93-Phaeocystis_antarctica.AAC.1